LTKIFKSKSKTLFVSKSDRIEERGSYSVVLSPEFYWIKKVTLPVKKEKEALKLAPSIYDGFLPAGEFSYEVRKCDDAFIMIAYNKKKITDELDKVLPYKGDIAELYFAQDALSHIDACTEVDGKSALTNMDGIIIQVPRACTDTETTLDELLEKATLGKRKVKLSSFDNELLSSRDIKLIAAIFSLLFFAFLSEYIVYKKALTTLETQRAEIIQENNLPRTSIQLKSIKKSLSKKFDTQKRFRETLLAISKLRLKSGEYIQSIEEGTKDATIKIVVTSDAREEEIKKMFPKDISIKESSLRDNVLKIRISS